MLFSSFLPEQITAPERFAIIDKLLVDLRLTFPDLRFEARLDRRIVNAQATLLNGKRSVLIYGGIALHPQIGEQSLTFVSLHEVGHHLAMGARLQFDPSLACDCVADSWAVHQGAGILFKKTGRRLEIEKAIDELDLLMADDQNYGTTSSETHRSGCWSLDWAQRRGALLSLRTVALTHCESK